VIELDEAVVVPTRNRVLGEIAIGVAATLAALGVWLAWTQVGGVDLTVRSADVVREVGAMSVAMTALVVSVAGVLLTRLLESWLPRGLRWWTVVACAVCAASMVGPLGATTVAAGIGLTTLHALVGAIVVFGVRQVHRAGSA